MHLLSATASDFRSSLSGAGAGRQTMPAPYGGVIGSEQMEGLELALLRTLRDQGAAAPDGKW